MRLNFTYFNVIQENYFYQLPERDQSAGQHLPRLRQVTPNPPPPTPQQHSERRVGRVGAGRE